MKPYSIPKKYAPYTPTPFAEVKVPPEVFVGFLYSCYFNIELHPTLTYGTKKPRNATSPNWSARRCGSSASTSRSTRRTSVGSTSRRS